MLPSHMHARPHAQMRKTRRCPPQGLIRVRQKMQWDLVLTNTSFDAAIKCISFTKGGDAWVGDEGGTVKVGGWHERVQPACMAAPRRVC